VNKGKDKWWKTAVMEEKTGDEMWIKDENSDGGKLKK
jgi:hypothetical protein